jgi:predicted RNase H-like HicB family nuclease
VPDLPGCVAAGSTRNEVVRQIRGAIEAHLEGLRNDGRPIPAPAFSVELVDVASHREPVPAKPALGLNGSGSSAPPG